MTDHLGRLSLLAREYETDLVAARVPRAFYATEEGRFSMYVDAVAQRAGPSSYCAEAEYVPAPTPWTADGVRAAFARFALES